MSEVWQRKREWEKERQEDGKRHRGDCFLSLCVCACVGSCGGCGVAWRPEVHVDKSHFVQRTTSGLDVVVGVAICGCPEQGERSTRWSSRSRHKRHSQTSFMNFTWRRVAYPTLWFIVLLLLPLLLLVVCRLRICIEGQCGTGPTIVVVVLFCVALCCVLCVCELKLTLN